MKFGQKRGPGRIFGSVKNPQKNQILYMTFPPTIGGPPSKRSYIMPVSRSQIVSFPNLFSESTYA